MYSTAGVQREHAERRIGRAAIPVPPASLDLDVLTLSCERDRLIVWRMMRSFLSRVGRPRSFLVLSDGSISEDTATALRRLSPIVTGVDFHEWAAEQPLPDVVRRFADSHVLGKKIAGMLGEPFPRPRLYVDSDIEFLRGAHRFRELVEAGGSRPRYQLDVAVAAREGGYDERIVSAVREMLPRVSSGFNLLFEQLDWAGALDALAPIVDAPTFLTEQTTFAVAMTDNAGLALPEDDYVLQWHDLDRPWDAFARKDVVMRHYGSALLRWKMWLKGGDRGLWALPAATVERARAGRSARA